MPRVNSLVWTVEGKGKILDINYSLQTVTVEFRDGTKKDFDIVEIADSKEDLSDDIKDLKNLEG
jgi:hypothetical protein